MNDPKVKAQTKAPTGSVRFDEFTGAWPPRGRTTLQVGGPASGKAIIALRFLVRGARGRKQPGIFVAFEGSSKRNVADAGCFNREMMKLRRKKLFSLEARPRPDVVQSGNFELRGVFTVLNAKITEMQARRIVFDANADVAMYQAKLDGKFSGPEADGIFKTKFSASASGTRGVKMANLLARSGSLAK